MSQVPAPAWDASAPASLDGGIRVLYAEDDEVNVELVQAIISVAVLVAAIPKIVFSGAYTLATPWRHPPDLLLLDMHLGDMTGLALAWTLVRDPVTRHIPLVAMSADAMPEQIDAALAQGFACLPDQTDRGQGAAAN